MDEKEGARGGREKQRWRRGGVGGVGRGGGDGENLIREKEKWKSDMKKRYVKKKIEKKCRNILKGRRKADKNNEGKSEEVDERKKR